MKKIILHGFLLLFLIFMLSQNVSAVLSGPQSITLLSVSELDNGSLQGGIATLTLTIKPGKGAIFIESYPVSKIDTQVATRLAKEVACKFSNVDCSKYDFFYTIHANSPLIGGPSGGGATTVLTLASLEGVHLKKDFAMTGSILSGGIIGPVGGVRDKISAAKKFGKKFVIIPYLSIENKSLEVNSSLNKTFVLKNISLNNISNETNQSIDKNKYNESIFFEKPIYFDDLDSFGIKVYPVLTLEEAYKLATGYNLYSYHKPLVVNKDYVRIMKNISSDLCSRSEFLSSQIINRSGFFLDNSLNKRQFNRSMSLFNESSSVNDSYYTKASLCFSASVGFEKIILSKLPNNVLLVNKANLAKSLKTFSESIDSIPIKTMSDLESFVIVNERLLESQDFLDKINNSNVSSEILASAIERYKSAVAWSAFFSMPSQEVMIDNSYLSSACNSEINEAENRLTYLRLLVPKSYLTDVENGLSVSYVYRQKGEFAQCLFKATKTKADENVILSSLSVPKDKIPLLIKTELSRSKFLIASQSEGFPILGYSYYKYSDYFLRNKEFFSSLLFSEYSLAFSDLSKYFPPKTDENFLGAYSLRDIIIFFVGFLFGAGFFMILFPPKPRDI